MLQLGPGRKVCVKYFEGPGINGSLEQYFMNGMRTNHTCTWPLSPSSCQPLLSLCVWWCVGALALDIKKHVLAAYQVHTHTYTTTSPLGTLCPLLTAPLSVCVVWCS